MRGAKWYNTPDPTVKNRTKTTHKATTVEKRARKRMANTENQPQQEPCCISPLTTLLDSLQIFLRNPIFFLFNFALFTLPFSLLLFSLSFSSYPIKSQIYHLEGLALYAPIRFEALHVWAQSRANSLSLLRLKFLYFLPSYPLSLLAAITSISATAMAHSGRRPTVSTIASVVKLTWPRPLVTTIFVYIFILLYTQGTRTLAGHVSDPSLRIGVLVIGLCVEVQLMAVTSMGLVVSMNEERFGLDAIRIGSDLMKGSRVCGWVLSALFIFVSGVIGWKVEQSIDGEDLANGRSMVMINWMLDQAGLICLFGWVVIWSYIVMTVYYCDCRKRHERI